MGGNGRGGEEEEGLLTFAAMTVSDFLCLQRYTSPHIPLPIFFISSNSVKVSS